MPEAMKTRKQSKPKKGDATGGETGPSAQERAESGIKLAQHVQTALTGGKIRRALALWGAAKQLRVAAAGTGGVVKKYPLATALVGGGLAATAIYLAARSAGSRDDAGAEDGDEEQAEDQADDAGDEQDDAGEGEDEGDEEEEDADDEPSGENNRHGSKPRSRPRGR
jgi:hypothetical protein